MFDNIIIIYSRILLFSGPGCSLGWWGRTLLLLLGLLHLLHVRPPLLGANIAQLLDIVGNLLSCCLGCSATFPHHWRLLHFLGSLDNSWCRFSLPTTLLLLRLCLLVLLLRLRSLHLCWGSFPLAPLPCRRCSLKR